MHVLLQYQSKSYYIIGQEVYYSIGRFYYIIGRFYYIIGQLLQYRAFTTLSVGRPYSLAYTRTVLTNEWTTLFIPLSLQIGTTSSILYLAIPKRDLMLL